MTVSDAVGVRGPWFLVPRQRSTAVDGPKPGLEPLFLELEIWAPTESRGRDLSGDALVLLDQRLPLIAGNARIACDDHLLVRRRSSLACPRPRGRATPNKDAPTSAELGCEVGIVGGDDAT